MRTVQYKNVPRNLCVNYTSRPTSYSVVDRQTDRWRGDSYVSPLITGNTGKCGVKDAAP